MVSWWKASLASDSFGNDTYAEKLTLDFTAPAQGDYLVIFTAHTRSSNTNYSVGCRLQLDDSTTILESLAETYSTTEDDVVPISTFYLAENLSSGSHYVDLDCLVEFGTGYINDVKIVVLRLDDWLPDAGMYDSAATESSSDLTNSFATYETLTFTPDQAGEYLVLGTARFTATHDNEVAVLRLNYDSGAEYLPIVSPAQAGTYFGRECKDATDLYQNFWGGIVTIPASSKTILLEARSEITDTGTIHYRRIIAIRLGAMDSAYESDEDTSETTNLASTWVDKTSIDFTPPSTGEYLILGSILGYNGSGYSCFRVNHTTGTDIGVLQNIDPLRIEEQLGVSDSLSCSAFDIKSLGATQQIFKTEHREWTTSSSTNRARGSFIVAIRLPDPPDADPWVFGKLDDEIEFVNGSYNEKFTLEFNAPALGDYLILVSAAVVSSNITVSIGVRAQLDDTTTIMEHLDRPNTPIQTSEYRNASTVYLAQGLSAGAHYVDIDAYMVGGANYGYIRYMKIAVIRLDDWLSTAGMYDFTATEGEASLTDSWATYETLTFTPDQAGDYLVLGSCEVEPASASFSASVRLNYDAGSEYLPVINAEEGGESYVTYEALGVTDYKASVWGGIVNIPASSKTILLEGISTSATVSSVKKRRILVIRLAAMDSSAETDEDPANDSTTAQWTDKSTVTFTPPSTEDYLLLSGMIIKPDSVTYPGHVRLNQTAGTGTGVIGQTNVDAKDTGNPADCIPHFSTEVKSLANISQTFKTQFGYAVSSGTIYGKGSFIIAIRKPTGETTAYKDVPLKISVESEDSYQDIPLKVSVESKYIYKDVPLLISVESEDIYKDLTLKISISLAAVEVFKDVPLKISVESEYTYKDLTLKISVESSDEYKDVPLKVSIYTYQITGVTKDNAGSVLGSCEVFLVKDEGSNVFSFVAHTTSDGTGNYTFTNMIDNDANYQVIAWKDDAPHVFDVTDWVLQPETI